MADVADSRRRWDTDDRFTGVADASAFADAIEELAALARRPGWVAEEPEAHLVPHLRGADVAGLRLLECNSRGDGLLEVTAEHGPGDSRGGIRRPACVSTATATASSSTSSPGYPKAPGRSPPTATRSGSRSSRQPPPERGHDAGMDVSPC